MQNTYKILRTHVLSERKAISLPQRNPTRHANTPARPNLSYSIRPSDILKLCALPYRSGKVPVLLLRPIWQKMKHTVLNLEYKKQWLA